MTFEVTAFVAIQRSLHMYLSKKNIQGGQQSSAPPAPHLFHFHDSKRPKEQKVYVVLKILILRSKNYNMTKVNF